MKYPGLACYTPADLQALVSQCPPKDSELNATNQRRVGASLVGPEADIKIQPRGGKPKVPDSPFAETKEQVGWYLELHPIGFFGRHNARAEFQA